MTIDLRSLRKKSRNWILVSQTKNRGICWKQPDLWDDLSFLNEAISVSLSKASARKPVFMTVDVKRDKKRKTDQLLK